MGGATNTHVKQGELLALSRGEYSDYSVDGFFLALQDFDIAAIGKAFTAANGDEYGYCESSSSFPSYLVSQGLVLPITHREIHCGSYGHVEF